MPRRSVLDVVKERNGGADYTSVYDTTYADLLVASGLTIEVSEEFGDYQGDAIAVVKDEDGRLGIAVWGYGSCSGCDHLQNIAMGFDDDFWIAADKYAQEMRDSAVWANDGESLQELAARRLVAGEGDWWMYEDEMKEWVLKLAQKED